MLQVTQAARRARPEAGTRVCPPQMHSKGMEPEKEFVGDFPLGDTPSLLSVRGWKSLGK